MNWVEIIRVKGKGISEKKINLKQTKQILECGVKAWINLRRGTNLEQTLQKIKMVIYVWFLQ
jgi:hypothetical protein